MRFDPRSTLSAWLIASCVTASAPALANNPPDARDVRFSLEEDGRLVDVLEASDVDNDPLEFRVVRAPRHGKVTVEKSGKLVYKPNKNWHGTDEMMWEVSDGKKASRHKAVFDVESVNDTPIPGPAVTLNGQEDRPARGRVTGRDPDGDKVSFEIGRRPRAGSVEVDDRTGRFEFTPTENFHGTAKFTIEVTDGRAAADVPVTVNVAPGNDPPTTTDETGRGREDGQARGRVRARDIDGDKLTYAIATPPENGKVKMDPNKGTWLYTPRPNFNGSDEFEFYASDGKARAKGHVGIKIAPVNDMPSAERTVVSTPEDEILKAKVKASDPDGGPLFFSLAVKPRRGDVVVDRRTGEFNYTPFQDFHGKDKFSVDVGDGSAAIPAWVIITITPVNDKPEPVPAAVEVTEDEPATGKVKALDVDKQKITYSLARPARQGTVTVAADGSFKYTPKPDFNGEDSFQFYASDGDAKVKGDVLLAVMPVNDPPTAEAKPVTTREERSARGQVRAQDVDRDNLTYKLGSKSTRGTVTVDKKRGSFTYTPNKNQNGEDTVTIVVSDGKAETPVQIKVTITPVNDSPEAVDGKGKGKEDEQITGMLEASDVDGDKLKYSLARAPRKGKVEVDEATGKFTYTPEKNFNGKDAFRFQVTDGKARDTKSVSLEVTAVNDPPDAPDVAVSTSEDRATRGAVKASDVDRDKLSYALAKRSKKGKVELNERTGSFTFTPNEDDNGEDAFSVQVSDGKATTEATVSVKIAPVNDAPVAKDGEGEGNEDRPVEGKAVATDVDPDKLTYSISGNPRSGTAKIDAKTGAWTYTPEKNFNGKDRFTWTVSDGKAKDSATISVAIAEVNDKPVAKDVSVSTSEDRSVRGRVEASDIDRDKLTWALAKRSKRGKVTLDEKSGGFEYTPNDDENGEDAFSVTVSDGKASAEATVSVKIAPANDAPVAKDGEGTGPEDDTIQGNAAASDVDPDKLSYSVTRSPRFGTVKMVESSGAWTYTPKENFNGDDAFTWTVSDGKARDSGTVKLKVSPVNDAPVVKDLSLTGAEDRPTRGRISASDIDRDKLTYRVKKSPLHGTVELDDASGAFTYTPAANENGNVKWTVEVTDGKASSQGVVTVAVKAAPDAPVVDPRPVETTEDEEVVVPLHASDPDGDTITFRVVSQSSLGTANIEGDGKTLRFKPKKDKNGESKLTVEASDGRNKTRASLPVRVKPANDLPTLEDAKVSTLEERPVRVALRAVDIDGDATKLTIEQKPKNAEVSLDGRLLDVTPAKDFAGELVIRVAPSDNDGKGEAATVTVTVKNKNDPPVTKEVFLTTSAGSPGSGEVKVEDPDADETHKFRVGRAPKKGKVAIDDASSGRFTYTPKEGATGGDTFEIRVTDRAGARATAKVTVTIE